MKIVITSKICNEGEGLLSIAYTITDFASVSVSQSSLIMKKVKQNMPEIKVPL